MKRIVAITALALVLVLAFSVPAFAGTGSDGVGRDFGAHVSHHAHEMGGFTGDMNPGVMHRGITGWPMMM